MKDIKLKKLEESFEEGVISREEYEKKKKEIKEMPEKKKKNKSLYTDSPDRALIFPSNSMRANRQ